jgi:hypothetical protein
MISLTTESLRAILPQAPHAVIDTLWLEVVAEGGRRGQTKPQDHRDADPLQGAHLR